MRVSIRLRLALWYATLLAVIIAVASTFSYSFHSTSHYEEADRSLVSTAVHVLSQLRGSKVAGGNAAIVLPPVEEFASPDIYAVVYDSRGREVAASPNAARQTEADPKAVSEAHQESSQEDLLSSLMRPIVNVGQPPLSAEGGFVTVPHSQGRTRLYAVPITAGGTVQGYVETGMSLDWLDQSMDRLRALLAGTGLVGLLAALFGGWAIAAAALRPVADMTNTARAIALSRGFSRRLSALNRRDELGQMAETFNEMLASLDEAYRTQQRFIADASHELRTPLTAIQGNLDLLERARQLEGSERTEILAELRRESARMGRLVADLLLLARADAGQGLKLVPVELDRLVLEVFKEARSLARGQKVSLTGIDQLQVEGDPDRLKQLLLILVDNAIRYTPEGGQVRVALRGETGSAVVTVQDTGIGISPEDLPHIFERFYRADKARIREKGGAGLGLSIAQWIAERHGGSILVESSPGAGSTFTLRIPLPRGHQL